jgi:hypothetical protein
MEADRAQSKRDFRHKISICKEESNPGRRDERQKLFREAQELGLIFSSILLSKK